MAIDGAKAAAIAAEQRRIAEQRREQARRAAEAKRAAAAKKAQPKPKPQVQKLEARPKTDALKQKASKMSEALKARNAPKAKSPEELGRREGRKLATDAADRAEKKLGKPLSQANPHQANAALNEALEVEAKKAQIDPKELEATGKDGAKAFAKAYAEEAIQVLGARLGQNKDLVFSDTAGQKLEAVANDVTVKAAGKAFGEHGAKDAAKAIEAALPEPTPAEKKKLAQQRIEAAKDLPPREQADEIHKAVKSIPAKDRAELLKKNQRQLDALSEKIAGDPRDITDGDKAALTSLARIADISGPEGAKVVGTSLAGAIPKDTDTSSLSGLRQLQRAMTESSVDAGSTALARATASQALHSKNDTVATYMNEAAAGATELARTRFDDQQKKADQLNGKLNNYLAAAGPSLSPEDRQKLIARFKEKHAAEYQKLEDAAKSYGGIVRERDEVLKTTSERDPQTAKLRDAASHSNDSFDRYAQTKDGQALVRSELKKEAHGDKSEVLRGLELAHRSEKFRQGVQAGVVQAVTGTTLEGAKKKDFSETRELLKGLEANPELFGAGANGAKFNQVIDQLDGITKSDDPPTPEALDKLGETIDAIGGSHRSLQALKAVGSAIAIAKTVGGAASFDSLDLQDKVSTINDAIGLTAEGGSFLIDAIGKEGSTISKLVGGAGVASKVLGGILGGITAAKQFSEGKVIDGLLSAGVAAAALLEVPGANVVAAVLVAAQLVKTVIDAGNEKQAARDELRDLIDHTELKDLPPELKDKLIEDAPQLNNFKTVNELAEASGLPPRDFLDKVGSLPEEKRNWLFEHGGELKGVLAKAGPVFANSPEAVFDHFMSLSPAQRDQFLETTKAYENSQRSGHALDEFDETYDQFLAQHRSEGADGVYRAAQKKLQQGGLSEQEASAYRSLMSEADAARRDPEISTLPKERQLDHFRLHTPTAYLDQLRRQGILPPSRPYTGPH